MVTRDGQVLALDAKLNFDDNALYRHKDVAEMRDILEEEPLEVEASKYNLNYIKLDGNVGCMVNGAGLAMATMDVIKLAGGMPANFLDVGGGATAEMVKNGLKILVSDPKVKAILINIFGGILRCDTLAKGLIEATSEIKLERPGRHPHGRDECRDRPQIAEGIGSEAHRCRDDERGGPESDRIDQTMTRERNTGTMDNEMKHIELHGVGTTVSQRSRLR